MPQNALPNFGTSTNFDTLAASYQTILAFGEDRAWDAIAQLLTAHNRILADQMALLSDTTTDKIRRYGTPAQMFMQELDELGVTDGQKIMAGSIVGFPLKKYGAALQWTRTYFNNATASEIAAQVTAMLDADTRNFTKQLKRAFYSPINYTSLDRLAMPILNSAYNIPVKALVNADGLDLPIGPNGEVFDGTSHNHYLAANWGAENATQKNADMIATLETVLEHYSQGVPCIIINRADQSEFATLTDFIPYLNTGIRPSLTTTYAEQKTLDPINLYNRAIGQFHGSEVWVKPWGYTGYKLVYLQDQPSPLVMRVGENLNGELMMMFEDEDHPLRSRGYERQFGLSVWNRTNGAILYSGGTTYVMPTII